MASWSWTGGRVPKSGAEGCWSRLVAQGNFWDQLPQSGKAELEPITKSLLPKLEKTDAVLDLAGEVLPNIVLMEEPSAA